jgi:Golgi complex component 7 (COG7)
VQSITAGSYCISVLLVLYGSCSHHNTCSHIYIYTYVSHLTVSAPRRDGFLQLVYKYVPKKKQTTKAPKSDKKHGRHGKPKPKTTEDQDAVEERFQERMADMDTWIGSFFNELTQFIVAEFQWISRVFAQKPSMLHKLMSTIAEELYVHLSKWTQHFAGTKGHNAVEAVQLLFDATRTFMHQVHQALCAQYKQAIIWAKGQDKLRQQHQNNKQSGIDNDSDEDDDDDDDDDDGDGDGDAKDDLDDDDDDGDAAILSNEEPSVTVTATNSRSAIKDTTLLSSTEEQLAKLYVDWLHVCATLFRAFSPFVAQHSSMESRVLQDTVASLISNVDDVLSPSQLCDSTSAVIDSAETAVSRCIFLTGGVESAALLRVLNSYFTSVSSVWAGQLAKLFSRARLYGFDGNHASAADSKHPGHHAGTASPSLSALSPSPEIQVIESDWDMFQTAFDFMRYARDLYDAMQHFETNLVDDIFEAVATRLADAHLASRTESVPSHTASESKHAFTLRAAVTAAAEDSNPNAEQDSREPESTKLLPAVWLKHSEAQLDALIYNAFVRHHRKIDVVTLVSSLRELASQLRAIRRRRVPDDRSDDTSSDTTSQVGSIQSDLKPTTHQRQPSTASMLLNDAHSALQHLITKAAAFVGDIMFDGIKRKISGLRSFDLWTSQPPPSKVELPMFSPQPADYMTQIGEYLLTLVQQLEPFITTAPSIVSKSDNQTKNSELDDSSYWLQLVAERLVDKLVDEIRHIPTFSPLGSNQLASDLAYIMNVFKALGITEVDPLPSLQRVLSARNDELEYMKEEFRSQTDVSNKTLLLDILRARMV